MGKYKKLPHTRHYYSAVARNVFFSLLIMGFSLAIGVWGYGYFYNLSFTDALLNASMILTGMGPVDQAPNKAAKLFASFYALYSGIAFLTSAAVILSPVLHRFMHKFHLDVEE